MSTVCKWCKKEIDEKAIICPYCQRRTSYGKSIKFLKTLILILILFGIYYWLLH